MKNIFLLLCVMVTLGLYSQNRPKYILVPVSFSFSKMDNPYNLSALTKSYFQKEGFEAYLENEVLPAELAANRCLAWKADLKESNAFLVTKLVVEVIDCYGNSIAVSQEGKSREKERRIGYSEAFREAVKTLEIPEEAVMMSYMMIPSGENKTSNVQAGMSPTGSIEKSQSDFPTLQNNLNTQTQEKKELLSPSINASVNAEIYYAQPNNFGYQLVDSTPKIVLFLMKTSREDVFIGVRNEIKGVVYASNNQWYFEYYLDNELVSEKLKIKF
jgi:hypothetical protein